MPNRDHMTKRYCKNGNLKTKLKPNKPEMWCFRAKSISVSVCSIFPQAARYI